MRSIPAAMTWELYRRGRWAFLAAFLGANAFTAMLFTALLLEGGFDPQEPNLIVMHLVMTQSPMYTIGAAAFWALGNPSRIYAMPVPASTIAAWRMLPAMALVMLGSAASTAILNEGFGLGWPIWGPAMFGAVAFAAVQAAFWLTDGSGLIVPVVSALAVALSLWFKSRYGPIFSLPTHFWSETTPLEVATLLFVAVAAYLVACIAASRGRRGDLCPSLGIADWCERVFESAPRIGAPFGSADQAQFWFEWRMKGWILPVIVVSGLVVGVSGWSMFGGNPSDLFKGFVGGGGMLTFVAATAAIILGNAGSGDLDYSVGQFTATRPMSTTRLAKPLLKTAGYSVLIAWFAWAASFAVACAILAGFGLLAESSSGLDVGFWYFAATIVGPWIIAGLGASILLAGWSRSYLSASLIVGLSGFLLLSLASKALHHEDRMQLNRGLFLAGSAALFVGTIIVVVAARRHSVLRPAWIAAAWVALCTPVVLEMALRTSLPISGYLAVYLMIALALAPLAAAPLALASNRVR